MTWVTAVAIYFIIWWVVLFAILPWGVHSQVESGDVVPGSDPGAPALPRLGMKLMITTLVAGAIFGLCYAAYVYRLIPLDGVATGYSVFERSGYRFA